MIQHIACWRDVHLCMRFSITVKMENNPVTFNSCGMAALVAMRSSSLDGKTNSVPLENTLPLESSSSNELCQQAKEHGPM